MTVASPCIDICQFDRKKDMCTGCLRTTEEIRLWRKMTDHKRRTILSDRRRREAKLLQHAAKRADRS
ncbi:DUF1289 domain-containing protein [Rhodopseudomonas boonkerdii]|uniref:DUF1289 domain-containing protein n=1 Tax=Rhodopseudomonas boonkerdii TaxID=475937 RepID=UPI001E469574|nr:DUF1289 domain-containing protein [Rhodopseudomonas boonkerdii]UGV26957.1 DUF1289 domain-containing protein [Rhodopseudomonas boonkerdii]